MRPKEILFSLLPLIIIFLVAEAGLRVFGFQYSDTPLEVRIDNEKHNLQRSLAESIQGHKSSEPLPDGDIVKDRYQFWVPKKDLIRGRYSVAKPEGVTRIAALGCSCTWGCNQTNQSYSSILEKIMNGDLSKKYEVLNGGVGSYTSYQGLQRLKHFVLDYQPDVVTVFFGWNDHWFAQTEDKNVRMRGDFEILILNFLEKFRVYQGAHYLFRKILGGSQGGKVGEIKFLFRVSPEDYRANLTEMVRLIRERGAKPVLMTAPAEPSQLKPSWVFPLPPEQLINVHERYNQIVREVAKDNGADLIDLAVEVRVLRAADPEKTANIFSDGIHYSPFGCETIAKLIYVNLKKFKLV